MKRFIIAVIFLAAGITGARCQTHDTIYLRDRNYYYDSWYDSCVYFNMTFDSTVDIHFILDNVLWDRYYGRLFHTDYPMNVYGLSCMVQVPSYRWPFDDTGCGNLNYTPNTRVPEFLHLCLFDTVQNALITIDSVRWDTATYKVLKLPRHSDTSRFGFCYCHVYEGIFTKPVEVNGDFWVVGTSWGGREYDPANGIYYNAPSLYERVRITVWEAPYDTISIFCSNSQLAFRGDSLNNMSGAHYLGSENRYSPFNPIIRSKLLSVSTSDSALGTAGPPTGYVADSSYHDIYARPVRAARFMGWSDGGTGLDRAVYVTSDTFLTALFEARDSFFVSALSSNADMGSVTGGGRYYDGETAVLTAEPIRSCRFSRWDDGDTSNPRSVPVTSDTFFTAYFEILDSFWVNVRVNNEDWGTVEGGGRYYDGEEVQLHAVGRQGHSFLHWGGGLTTDSVTFMACDTTVEAYFSEYSAIAETGDRESEFRLVPNPARGSVMVEIGENAVCDGRCRVSVHDAAGREVRRISMEGRNVTIGIADLPAGVYYVTLISSQGLSTRRLVVER